MAGKCLKPTVWCGACSRGYKNEGSLAAHAYDMHPGVKRAVWFSRSPLSAGKPLPLSKGEPAAAAPIAPDVPGDLASAETPGAKSRTYPPRDDRHNAEILSGLPWITWPATDEACEEALNAINGVIDKRADRSMAFWCSLRAYVTELRKRIATRKPAA